MAEICSKTSAAVQDDIFAGLQFVLACRYHLVVGALTALRGHITDSFRNSRMAIESAAFAARVKRDPGLATVWLNAGHDDAAYKEYRNQFSKLFAGDDPVLRELGSRYDDCAKQGHPSVYAFAGHTKIEQTPTDLLVQFEYFQMRSDASEPVRTYLWILTTHLLIVSSYRTSWRERSNTIDTGGIFNSTASRRSSRSTRSGGWNAFQR